MTGSKKEYGVLGLLFTLFIIGIIVIIKSTNSFGGADNVSHYFAAHYGWQYPKLLFDHWSKPVFTILSSPFAQAGINGMRIYNLLLGLSTAYITYKTAQLFKLKSAFISLIFTVLAPIYFVLLFSSLTEITFSFFLILGVYLFFSGKLHWSAIVFGFLPIIRTEGIILFSLFALAYGLKKSYFSILLLSLGFFLISIAGYPFHTNFWWLITEMPYGGSTLYGSGHWYHFIANTRKITGILPLLFFITSFIIYLIKYLRKGILRFEKEFYILLLIFAPFMAYFAAHSYVWATGQGGSLGLIRVIGAVVPLVALGANFSYEYLYKMLQNKSRYFNYILYLIIALFMYSQAYHIYRWAFFPSTRDRLMQQASNYIQHNHLDKNFIVYYDTDIIYLLDVDPYDNDKAAWMINDRQHPSLKFPQKSLIVWDSHFGNNEGQMPLQNLLNDPNLVLINKIKPEKEQKTLGGYNYEIDIFQKKSKEDTPNIRHFKLTFNPKDSTKEQAFFSATSKTEFLPGLEINNSNICQQYTQFNIDVSFDIQDNGQPINDLILVLSQEGNTNYFYKAKNVKLKNDFKNNWQDCHYQFDSIGIGQGNEILKIYLWNKGKSNFNFDNFTIDFKQI